MWSAGATLPLLVGRSLASPLCTDAKSEPMSEQGGVHLYERHLYRRYQTLRSLVDWLD